MMSGVLGVIISLFWVFVVVVILVILTSCIRIVRQAQALVIERLGAYQTTLWSPWEMRGEAPTARL